MHKTKTIMITGSDGFVGSHLCDVISRTTDWLIIKIGRCIDITDRRKVAEMFNAFNPDAIIHLAAKAAPATNDSQWLEMLNSNIMGTANLLHCSPVGCRFIFASSIVVYGDWLMEQNQVNSKLGLYVSEYMESYDCKPTSAYAASKLASEQLVTTYTRMGRVSGINLRLCAVVGSRLTHGALKDIIRKSALDVPTLPLMGNAPGSTKPYIHIDDVVRCIMAKVQSQDVAPINIVPGDSISIDKMSDLVLEQASPNRKEKVWSGQTFIGDNNVLLVKRGHPLPKFMYETSEDAVKQAIKDNILCT